MQETLNINVLLPLSKLINHYDLICQPLVSPTLLSSISEMKLLNERLSHPSDLLITVLLKGAQPSVGKQLSDMLKSQSL